MKRRIQPRTVVLIAAVVVVLAAAVVLLIRFFPSFGSQTAAEPGTVQQDEDRPTVSDGAGDGTETLQAPGHAIGSLTVHYADGALTRTDGDGGLVTLQPDPLQALPRLDLQKLDGSLQDLTDAEIQRLATGLVQAYYVDAPAAGELTVTADQTLLHAFLLEVPAVEDAPALSAQVRFLEASDGLWYLTLLYPAGETVPDGLQSAYENAVAN